MKQYLLNFNNVLLTFLIWTISLFVIYNVYMYKDHYVLFDRTVSNKLNMPVVTRTKKENINLIIPSCNYFNCFDIYRCGNKGKQLLIYVYPQKSLINPSIPLENSYFIQEFDSVLKTIKKSKYYTKDPNEACVFVPSVDVFKLNRREIDHSSTYDLLQLIKNGKNHLIFDFIIEESSSFENMLNNSRSEAMIAGIGFTNLNYRRKFDISFPALSTVLRQNKLNTNLTRKWLLISCQLHMNSNMEKNLLQMKTLFPNDFQIFYSCSIPRTEYHFFRCLDHGMYKYPEILQTSTFCLLVRGKRKGLSLILEALATRCIPVIVYDSLIMPFDEVIDWSRAAIFIQEPEILSILNLLKKYSLQKVNELQKHGTWLYNKYFKSIKVITETTLDIISNRVFTQFAKNYNYWNEPEYSVRESPIYLPLTSPKNGGFTAVILTYDRIDLLFLLIQKISKVPGLKKILIVWNNVYKKPPRLSRWPKIYKLIKIIQTNRNLLSNRFYPFEEIETEAVLSIDDDIIMLTEDEIEFAFEVWREFPDRIVGFPSRTHTWDNKTICWKYESEWTNRVSMVLTGAAFYHKYWNHAFTTALPMDIKQWINDHMNCEDIAMNFLVSNITGKAPIKVTAKKKFRCPECINTEMLSADITHMVERTHCINQFTRAFGQMPLKSVEFRADPVLFKDNFPDKLKRFNNVGSL